MELCLQQQQKISVFFFRMRSLLFLFKGEFKRLWKWFLKTDVNLRSGFGWWSWILTRPQTQLTRPDIVWKDLRMESFQGSWKHSDVCAVARKVISIFDISWGSGNYGGEQSDVYYDDGCGEEQKGWLELQMFWRTLKIGRVSANELLVLFWVVSKQVFSFNEALWEVDMGKC